MTSLHEAVFYWPHPEPNEVILTGTFDQWKGTVHMQKSAVGFEAHVLVPWGQKALYKFVVDGRWTLHEDQPTETDPIGNVNNVYDAPPMPPPPAPAALPALPSVPEVQAPQDEPKPEPSVVPDKVPNGKVEEPEAPTQPEELPSPPVDEISQAAHNGDAAEPVAEDVIMVEVIEGTGAEPPFPPAKDVAPVVPHDIIPVTDGALPELAKVDLNLEPTHQPEPSVATSATAVSQEDANPLPPSTHTPAGAPATADQEPAQTPAAPEAGADSEAKPISTPADTAAPPPTESANDSKADEAQAKPVPSVVTPPPADEAKKEEPKEAPLPPPPAPQKKQSSTGSSSAPSSPVKYKFPAHIDDGRETISSTTSKRKKRLSILDKVKGLFHHKSDGKK